MPRVNKKPQYWFKQKTRSRMSYEWIGKTFGKKFDPKNRKKRKSR